MLFGTNTPLWNKMFGDKYESDIKSMRPQSPEELEQMLRELEAEGWKG